MGESTSVTLLPSAKTAYPVTGAILAAMETLVAGIQVTRIVPSCGPPSTRTSIGGSGNATKNNHHIGTLVVFNVQHKMHISFQQ